jgi:hypothetical protein
MGLVRAEPSGKRAPGYAGRKYWCARDMETRDGEVAAAIVQLDGASLDARLAEAAPSDHVNPSA